MASIRLFGRGRNTAATGGPAVGAALIADVLENLTAASMSTTWRCRHSTGVSIGEGAVDFAAGRSRSTVIRGKYTFEYVRSGASAYRTAVTDEDAAVSARTAAGAGVDDVEEEDEDDAEIEIDEALEAEEDEAEGDDEEEDGDDEFDAEAADDDGEDGDEEEDDESEDDDGDVEFDGDVAARERPSAAVSASVAGSSGSASAWERFSEHDACGVHAYAEPAVLAAGVRAAGVVQPRDAQEFDGVKLAAYAVTLKPKPADPNRVLARLARQLRDHGANVVVVTAFVDESQADAQDEDESGAPNGDVSESVAGGDGGGAGGGARIVRLRIELPHWTPADDPTADHSVSVDLYEFGEPVSVEVPEGAGRRTARSCADLALF